LYFHKYWASILEIMVNLIEIHEFCKDKDLLLGKLREWRLIPNQGDYNCPNCASAMKLLEASDRPDKWQWYCGAMISRRKQAAQKCHTRVEFRTGTFFAGAKLSIYQVS
jgi:hypothetical protein